MCRSSCARGRGADEVADGASLGGADHGVAVDTDGAAAQPEGEHRRPGGGFDPLQREGEHPGGDAAGRQAEHDGGAQRPAQAVGEPLSGGRGEVPVE